MRLEIITNMELDGITPYNFEKKLFVSILCMALNGTYLHHLKFIQIERFGQQ
jgi:hypothetical protein